MAQIAIAWILSKEGVTAPVVGTTKLKNLEDIIGACCALSTSSVVLMYWGAAAATEIELTEDEKKYLEEPYVNVPILGHK